MPYELVELLHFGGADPSKKGRALAGAHWEVAWQRLRSTLVSVACWECFASKPAPVRMEAPGGPSRRQPLQTLPGMS